jgi:hypothetical protein
VHVQLPELLTTAQVVERYGCDARAARRLMRKAGVLFVAGRLLVPVDALAEWERRHLTRRVAMSTHSTPATRPIGRPRADLENLPTGFWRVEAADGAP